MRLAVALAIFMLMLPIANASLSGESRIFVVSTLEVFSSIVEEVGGDYVTSDYIIPQGSDIHDYSLTPKDIEKIKSADMIVLAGSNYFPIDSKILSNVGGQYVLDFKDYNATLYPLGSMKKNYHGYWLYPKNAIGIARAVYIKLSEIDTVHESYYHERYLRFLSLVNRSLSLSINLLKNSGVYGGDVLLAVPGTFYVAEAFGFNVSGVLMEGPNHFSSQSDLKKYEDAINSGKIKMIINAKNLENSKAGSMAIELSKLTGVKVAYVDIFSTSNYSMLMLKNAAILSSVSDVSSYSTTECYTQHYVYIIAALSALSGVLGYLAYSYRRELLR